MEQKSTILNNQRNTGGEFFHISRDKYRKSKFQWLVRRVMEPQALYGWCWYSGNTTEVTNVSASPRKFIFFKDHLKNSLY